MRPISCGVLGAAAALLAASGAQAVPVSYFASMLGIFEDMPNNSPGSGSAVITIDTAAHTLRVQAGFSGLTSGVTAAHIHAATAAPFAGTAGVATPVPTFPGFPSGVTSGSYDMTFDLTQASSWNPMFITNNGGSVATAETALAGALASGRAYLNIHTTMFGGGEIRGFAMVPSPGAAALLGAAGLVAARRRR